MIIKRDMIYTPNGKNRILHIWLPDEYDWDREARYPVMYFFDGHNLFFDSDATYGKCWGLKEYLKGTDLRMIVVGMECSHEGNDRLNEYSPYDGHGGFMTGVHGIGDQTMRWIVDDIKPMIDREYRTIPDREHTGIAGSSMGGLMSMYAAVRYGHVFSKAACVSTALLDEMEYDACGAIPEPGMRIYQSWGTEEAGGTCENPEDDMKSHLACKNLHVASCLRERGADVMVYCQRGGYHCEASWEKQIPIFMDHLWRG